MIKGCIFAQNLHLHMSKDSRDRATIDGFSRLSKDKKIAWVSTHYAEDPSSFAEELHQFQHTDPQVQKVLDGFSENTLANFPMPYGVAPNFLINGKVYCVPMVIEESSVVAAASAAAKFWLERGGFHTRVIDTRKIGQVHFLWRGRKHLLERAFPELEKQLRQHVAPLTANMEQRGGGILDIQLRDMNAHEPHYYQLLVEFETCDSMGANFINSVLENFARTLEHFALDYPHFSEQEREVDVLMAILSNYTPDCLVKAWVRCPIAALGSCGPDMDAHTFAERFRQAVRIAQIDPYRATTHNKGIFNGIDAVVIATGNDFRAVEACGHTWATRTGQYRSLSQCRIKEGVFHFELELPLAIGTVGGLTRLHPLASRSLEMLGNPSARELMQIIAAVGLAQNFAAVRSLVTTGIQKGHMKMHLLNILNHLGADEQEIEQALQHFSDKVVSFALVRQFLEAHRQHKEMAKK